MCELEDDSWLDLVDLFLFLRDLRDTCVHSWESLGEDIVMSQWSEDFEWEEG